MSRLRRGRWHLGLAVSLVSCGLMGATPVQAESVPVIVPPITAVVAGVTPAQPPVVVGMPGMSGVHSRDEVTWSTTGRADVDVDLDQHHGQAAVR
jgi:hypothetical protein